MKKINLFFICLLFTFSCLSSCSPDKDLTKYILPFFQKGASYEVGFVFKEIGGRAKLSIGDEFEVNVISDSPLKGMNLKYSKDNVSLTYDEISFTEKASSNDPFYNIYKAFQALSNCQFKASQSETNNKNDEANHIFTFDFENSKISLHVDKVTYVPYSLEINVDNQKATVYFSN